MELIDREAVLEIIDEITEIRGTTYIEIVYRITNLPTKAVIRDCDGCVGASFGDCADCEKERISND